MSTLFSVYSGPFSITSQNTGGSGAAGSPWLMSLVITATSPSCIVEISGRSNVDDFDGPLTEPVNGAYPMTLFASGDWLTVTILNSTPDTWTSFATYPEIIAGAPSGDFDGFSFMQDTDISQWCDSDKFASNVQDNDPDIFQASDGSVAPGQTVVLIFPLTMSAEGTPLYIEFVPAVGGATSGNRHRIY